MNPNFIVGIGGSAGALNASKALLDSLPSDTGMAFVLASQIHPTATSQLTQILSRHTKMPVTLASTAMPIRANRIYVIPPNADLLIDRYAFKVASPRTSLLHSPRLRFVCEEVRSDIDEGQNPLGHDAC